VALLEKRRFLYNHSGDFPQVILIVPSHVPNNIVLVEVMWFRSGSEPSILMPIQIRILPQVLNMSEIRRNFLTFIHSSASLENSTLFKISRQRYRIQHFEQHLLPIFQFSGKI
jgi:hypothetical protein